MSAIVILLQPTDFIGLRDGDFYDQRLRERTVKWRNYRHPPQRTRPLLAVDNTKREAALAPAEFDASLSCAADFIFIGDP